MATTSEQKPATAAKQPPEAMLVSAPPALAPNSAPAATKNVLVVVRGNKMDAELVKLACSVARPKQMGIIAIYGVEIPRSRSLDEPLLESEDKAAREALNSATVVAERCDYEIEHAVMQTRSLSHTIVEEANLSTSSLLVMGLPYQEKRSGKCSMDEEIDYVLEHATCRVWLIRGSKETA